MTKPTYKDKLKNIIQKEDFYKKKTKLTPAKRKILQSVFGMWKYRVDVTDNWLVEGRANLKSNWKED